jgi:tripartite-type tricarboxylate transporter receptor subunit TctC
MKLLQKSFWFLAFAGLSAQCMGQAFPVKPLKIIIPFSPGGPQDAPLRPLAIKLGDALGQPVVIDYKPGAATVIGTDFVAKSPADGYTLLGAAGSFTASAATIRNLPYDQLKDFAAVSPVSLSPIVLVANPKLGVGSVKELIALAKSRPGKLNYASNGTGASMHLAMELFKMMAGVDMVHVPYKGAGPGLMDVVAGSCDLMFVSAPIAIPQVDAGKLRLVGVANLKRSLLLPNSPTLSEAGLARFEANSMVGLLAPAGTPRAAISRINAAIEVIVAQPEIKTLFAANGLEPWWASPEQFTTWLRDDVARWKSVTKAINYQPE